jgi:adenylate cyclase
MKLAFFQKSSFKKKEKILCLFLPLGTSLFILLLWLLFADTIRGNPIDAPHHFLQDNYFRMRNDRNYYTKFYPKNKMSPIVLVLIDDKSLKELKQTWPIKRSLYVDLLTRLNSYKPKAIGLDILFLDKSPMREDDELLAKYLIKQDNIILGYKLNEASFEPDKINYPAESLISQWPEGRRKTNCGYVDSAVSDYDGVTRKTSLLMTREGTTYYSFDSLILARYLDLPLSSLHDFSPKGYQLIGDIRIPAPSGLMRINHILGSFEAVDIDNNAEVEKVHLQSIIMPCCTLYRLFDHSDEKDFDTNFKDKIVLVGVSAEGGGDIKKSPLGRIEGITIHGSILLTVLFKRFLVFAPLVVDFALIVIPAILLTIALPYLSPQLGACVTFIFMVLTYRFFYGQFSNHEIIYRFDAYSLFNLFLTYCSVTMWHFAAAQKARARLKSLLMELAPVPEPVLEKIMQRYEGKVALGGEKVELTILFSDIRGYTSISQNLDPREVMDTLNEYYSTMGLIYKRNGGMLFDYMGDGQMVVFGVEDPTHSNHAANAVKSAVQMLNQLGSLNDQWQKSGRKPVGIGIGINTGFVSLGFLGTKSSGHAKRFAAIGDTTNVASRIEGLTKDFKTPIIITESTYEKTGDIFEVEALPPTKVKGKDEAIRIYKVLGMKIESKKGETDAE